MLAAGYLYVSLPWLVEPSAASVWTPQVVRAVAVRRLNVHVLSRLSHGWNTFPSGHVAVAVAAALSVTAVSAGAGYVFLIVAAGVKQCGVESGPPLHD